MTNPPEHTNEILTGKEPFGAHLEAYTELSGEVIAEQMGSEASVLRTVVAERIARMPADNFRNIAGDLLHPNPKAIAERYRILSGDTLPGQGAASVEDLIKISLRPDMPAIEVPQGREDDVMELADKLQMRGGGPAIFCREEISSIQFNPDIILVHGAANKAPWERFQTALDLAEATKEPTRIIATAGMREVRDGERKNITGFYLEEGEEVRIRTERDLVTFAAMKHGFEVVIPEDQAGPTRYHVNGVESIRLKKGDITIDILTPPSQIVAETDSGLHAGYVALGYSDLIPESKGVESAKVAHITSTHYGPMALLNSARAQELTGLRVADEIVVGDNQPTRTPKAHLIEACLVADKQIARQK